MDKKNIEDIVALTPMQEGMLFHYLEDPDNDRYFEQLSLNISGPIDIERFQQAWKFVIKTNEMLRTCFAWKQVKNPVQVVARESTLDFRCHDISDIGGSPGSENINPLTPEDIKIKDRQEKFKLEEVPFRVTLCRIGECRYEMIVSNHHILYDGWSNGIILEEFFAAYNGLSRGNKCLPSPLKTTFREFVAWIKNRDKNKQENYWKNYLSGVNTKIGLPVKSGNVELTGIRRAENFQVRFPPGMDEQLGRFAGVRKITPASVFYSAWGILLQRYNGVDDAVFGTTVSGRSAKIKDIENIVGLFINTLPLRIQTAPGKKIDQLLLETNETLQTREEYETTSLVDIKAYCRAGNDEALFNSIVVIGNYPLDNLAGENSVLSVNGYTLFEMTNYDLTVGITTAGGIQIDFLYNEDLFEKEAIERLSGHFSAIAGEILDNPGKEVGRIEMLSREEKNRLLVDFNETAAGYPRDQLIHGLFAEQVAKTPDSTAVVFENNHLTYKELDERANRLAHLLRLKGVKPDTIVGLIGDFSLEMPVGIMGIFKADGAFLPIRSDYPVHRVEYMLKDSDTRLLVSQVDVRTGSRPFRFDGEIIEIYDEAFYTKNTQSERPVPAALSANLAYLMYTSGSTGKPKGVLVEHRSVINLVYWFGKTYGLQPGIRVVQLSDYTFDPIDEEIFATWLHGGVLHVVPRELLTHVQRLRRYIEEKQVHMVNCVPTFLKELLAHDRKLECIRLVISGGDRLDNAGKDMLLDRGYVVYNHYGLIETTLDVLTSRCFKERWASLVRPMANAKAYILDKDNRPLPIGAAGELCIAGDAVVRGYSNKPELDMERFPGSPFHRGELMLRTGDLARVLADGNIEILGRIDDQVKVRGFRIELGEIASQLLNHPGVKDAAVITRGNQEKRQVYAYYVDGARHKPELFPSVGEYPLYDDFLYYALTNDERRNKSYRAAINRLVKDKTAVEIGTGQDAVLARYCLDAGVKKIYAIEMSRTSYEIARETVRKLGLEDKIILVHGDATVVELPEKVDICISEIIGTIGGSEGAAAVLKNARRFLKEDGLMIPVKCITKIAAVHLPEVLRERPGFSEVGAGYIKKLFDFFGYKFDFRIGVKRFPGSHIISNAGIFEQLDFNCIALEAAHEIHLVMNRDTTLDGFLLWINLHTVEDEIIDTLEQEYSWMPVFVPLASGGIRVSRGDVIKAECSRKLSRNNINPDYTVKGILTGESRPPIAFECHLPYYEKRFSGTPFHRKILDDTGAYARYINRETGAAGLRSCLESKLPAYMIPSYFIKVDRIPLTPNGKVDTKALPVPGISESYEPPRDNLEKKLVELWVDVLGVETVGITDNFFTLGGHSLKATILVSRIGKAFDVEFPLNVVYSRPTVKEFARFIRTARRSIFERIQPVEEREYYPLSSAQKRIFLLEQFENIGTSYNGFSAHKCLGKFDKKRFQDILTRLIQRHENLRTSYHVIDNQPVQRIHDNVEFKIEHYLATEVTEVTEERKQKAMQILQDKKLPTANCQLPTDFVRPFDLTRAPLIRVGVITLSEEEHLLLFDIHHIASDGTSNAVLVDEFVKLYRGEPVEPLRIRYKDFVRWQNRSFALPEMKQQEAFWLDVFSCSGEIPVLNLPCDYARPEVQGFAGSRVSFAIGKEETGALKAFALREDATLYMVLLAIYNVLLSKVSGQEDIVVGSPIAGRRHVDLEPVVGMFVNTLAMRNYPSGEKSFKRFLAEVGARTRKAFENQDYPFESLVEKAAGKIKRDTGRNPLFDVMLVLQNIDIEEVDAAGMKLLPYPHESRTSKFDLNLEAVDTGEGLTFNLEYSTNLFKEQTIHKLTGYFKRIIKSICEAPGIKSGEIEILGENEKQEVLNLAVGPQKPIDEQMTIHRWFEEQSARTPDGVAVVGGWQLAVGKGESESATTNITYGELNEKSNQLAYLLRSRGIKPGIVVGLVVERSLEMIAAILGILKAGGAYLPIDPGYPPERIQYMLEDSGVRQLLTNCELDGIPGYFPGDMEIIDIGDETIYSGDTANPSHNSKGTGLVYVIYTSGSTGKPRGVMMKHGSLVNLLRFQQVFTNIGFNSVLQFTTISFDVSFQEIFSALLAGGRLYVVDKELRTDIPGLSRIIKKNKIETLFLPPSFLKFIFNEEDYIRLIPGGVRHIVTAGEQLVIPERFGRYLEENRVYLHNHYGPAETHVVTTYTMAPGGKISPLPPIGKPVLNTGIYILDNRQNLQPVGVPGELYIGGMQVGRGYLNRPELTNEKFLRGGPGGAVFSKSAPPGRRRLYKTGDLARWLPDGNIHFLGRIDHQVKIRGFRIEPGEIEARLLKHAQIKQAAVLARENEKGNKYLCAYIAPVGVGTVQLRQFLLNGLPDYMVPSYFVFLDEIPLNPNGKIDRGALPEPEAGSGRAYAAPRDEIQEKIVELWESVLFAGESHPRPTIGIDDNFFELGGHSLAAAVLLSKMHKVFDVKLSLVEIFKKPTIRGLSGCIKLKPGPGDKFAAIEPVDREEYYMLSSAQKRLHVLQQMNPSTTVYNLPVFFAVEGNLERLKLEAVFKKLIRRHDSLRTSFHLVNNQPVQKIEDDVEFEIEHDPGTFIRPFDLSRAPLLRAGLIESGQDRYLLPVDMHHIISDGISHEILARDFTAIYKGKELPSLRIQYKDFSLWQDREKEKQAFRFQETYWLREFSGSIPVLELPLDYPRPLFRVFEGCTTAFEIDKEETLALKRLALNEEATLHMVLLAVFTILLSKLTNQEDIVVGTPAAGRGHADLENVIGMFVNMLALRNHLAPGQSFIDFLRDLKEKALTAFENQDYQFEDLVEKVEVLRDPARNPLFDVVFVMQAGDIPGIDIPGLKLIPYPYENNTSKFDLTLQAIEVNEKLALSFEYCSRLFREDTVRRFIIYFKGLLSAVLENPGQTTGEMEILTDAEKQRILVEFSGTEAGYPTGKTIHELFEGQAERTPDHIAVKGAHELHELHEEIIKISYKELNEKSNQLAHMLRQKGVQPDSIVGIMMGRSVEMIIGILAILKAGGAYLPIDPDYPQERVDFMLKDGNAVLLLTGRELELLLSHREHREHREKKIKTSVSSVSSVAKNPPASSLAYIIYTSGTTGKPKGCMIEHGNVVRLLFNDKFQFDFNEGDVWTLFHSFCFDFSVWEMYGALLYGGRLVIIPKMVARDTGAYLDILKKENVTVLNQTPSAFYGLVEEELKEADKKLALRYVIFGGEALSPIKLREWNIKYPGIKLINMFGITETTVHVTYKEIGRGEIEANIGNIGKPIPTLFTYILDRRLGLVPVGVAGELCVGGEGVCRGYLNRPELTNEKLLRGVQGGSFLEKSPPGRRRQKIYRSGDLGRWLPDGDIEYLGRIDHQVKIRGFRIELGEIENRLLRHDKIKDTVVLAREDIHGDKYLCAYYVSIDGDVAAGELRSYLSRGLPDYMIPLYFVKLDRVPLTPNGKIKREALPEPQNEIFTGDLPGVPCPYSEVEEKLAEIWSEVLLHPTIGIHESFFNLGGDSIKAIRLVNLINTELDTDLKIADLYINDTIGKLAKQVNPGGTVYRNEELQKVFFEMESLKREILAGNKFPHDIEDIYPMSDIEKGMVFHSLKDIDAALYHDQFIYRVNYDNFNTERFRKALTLMVEKHPVLRTAFDLDGYKESVQLVYKNVYLDFELHDISSKDENDQEEYIKKIVRKDRQEPFNITVPPLWRLRIFGCNDGNIVLLWIFHHAILDGWSNASFITELNNTYLKLDSNPGYNPGKLESSYKEFIAEQIIEKRKNENIDYWRKELTGYKRLDFSNILTSPGEAGKTGVITRDFSGDLLSRLRDTARKEKTSVKNLCFAAYVYMLYMISYENDLVVGLVTNNRPVCEDGDKILGCFLNTIPVRVIIAAGMTWSGYTRLIDQKMLELKTFERFPFFEITKLTGETSDNRNLVFDTFFNYIDLYVYNQVRQGISRDGDQNVLSNNLALEGHENSNTLLDLTINTTFAGFTFYLSYSTAIIDENTAVNLFNYYECILKKIIYEPGNYAAKDEILPAAEKQRVLYDFNDTEADYPGDKTILELFAGQAARTPDSVAVIGQGDGVTYRELNRKSNRLAYLLRSKGVKPGNIVGLMVGYSLEMIIGVLGIWKAGGVYLPIDSKYPENRINFMLKDSKAEVLLTAHEIREICRGTAGRGPGRQPAASLAYIIYTSGTTGKPKGVLLKNENLTNYVTWFSNAARLTSADKSLLVSSFAFDLGYTAVYPSLANGGQLHIVSNEIFMSPGHLSDYIYCHHITYLKMTPSLFSTLVDPAVFSPQTFQRLRLLVLGGEEIVVKDVERLHAWCGHIEVMNHYGPTESTIGSATGLIDFNKFDEYEKYPVIGRPISNTRVFILDRNFMTVPIGVPGELCIGGPGVARGYLNRPELTAERFIGSPYSPVHPPTHSTIYRTGDFGMWMPDGNIMFLGRIDKQRQLKIRGYRIELGEIENRLSGHDSIKEVIVAAREDKNGNKYLCAYVVPHPPYSTQSLKEYLSKDLPDYMIPSYFIFLDKIPLTANGKVDRKALPEPGIESGGKYAAPRDELEKKLEEIWAEVLSHPTIGIDDNFFEIGGHSLKATLAIIRIHKELGREVPLARIFKTPTIRGLAGYIKRETGTKGAFRPVEPAEKREYYPLSPAQKGLYVHQVLDRGSTAYNGPRVVTIEGEPRLEKLETAVMKLMRRHESLRTSFHMIDDEPVQKVHETVEFGVEFHDLAPDEKEKAVTDFVRAFDLGVPPLVRVGLIKLEHARHILVIDMHHIITDGVSHYIFVKEFTALYRGEEPPPLRIHYKDYSLWMSTPGIREVLERQEAFWLKRFRGSVPGPRMPYDYERPAIKRYEGGSLTFEIDVALTARLNGLAKETETTMFMVLLAAYYILLWNYTGQEDIVVGSPITGRSHVDLQHIMGMFVNMLALRSRPRADKTVKEFLMEIKEVVLLSMENQDYHFEELAVALGLQGNPGRNPLFDVVFAMNNHDFVNVANHDFGDADGGSLLVSDYNVHQNVSRFDILIGAFENTDAETGERTIRMVLEYAAGLFKPATAERLRTRYIAILEQLVLPGNRDCRRKLEDIDMSYGLLAADTGAFPQQPGELEFDF